MEELEKTARELIWAITEKTLKSLKDKGLLKELSKLQMLCSSPEMKSLIKKLSAPKYNPCRPFKKGDIVKPKENVYAESYAEEPLSIKDRYVVERVLPTGWLIAFAKNECETFEIWGGMLELVTPVEEQSPFNLYMSDDNEYVIAFEDLRVSTFPFKGEGYPYYYTQEQAKAAAEAERDRLNAEYRKEQK